MLKIETIDKVKSLSCLCPSLGMALRDIFSDADSIEVV